MSDTCLSNSGLIRTGAELREQYRDPSRLNARAAIYRYAVSPMDWHGWVRERIGLSAGAHILEVGCGAGGLWAGWVGGWRICLTDLMPGMLQAARGKLGEGFAYVQANAVRLPFPDGRFDGVVANHMLYHVPDRITALREFARVARPGGRVVVGTNGQGHLQRLQQIIRRPAGQGDAKADAGFTMENGLAVVQAVFGAVRPHHLQGELRVTDASAVVEYVLSVDAVRENAGESEIAALHAEIDREIRANGHWTDHTHSGLFIAGG